MGHAIIQFRYQLPVGQGFFHFAEFVELATSGERYSNNFAYVYDCGSTKRYSADLTREIGKLKKRHHFKKIDILFISHFHYDHVSGIQELLSGLRVDTVVMPLVDDVERLIVYAEAISQYQFRLRGITGDALAEYQKFIADPIAVIKEKSENSRVFLVENEVKENGEEHACPNSDGEWPEDDNSGKMTGDSADRNTIQLRIVPRTREKSGEAAGATAGDWEGGTKKLPFGFQVGLQNGFQWLLLPFVDPSFAKSNSRKKFITALSDCLKLSEEQTVKNISKPEERLKILRDHSDCLKMAYSTISGDLNLTTLSLYSGPCSSSECRSYLIGSGYRCHRCGGRPDKVAWLGTGDANLKCDNARISFLKYFETRLGNVGTMTLPHHGSENSFHPELVEKIRPRYCVVAADRNSNWRHPASSVIQAVASAGLRLHVTTSHVRSKFEEAIICCGDWA